MTRKEVQLGTSSFEDLFKSELEDLVEILKLY